MVYNHLESAQSALFENDRRLTVGTLSAAKLVANQKKIKQGWNVGPGLTPVLN